MRGFAALVVLLVLAFLSPLGAQVPVGDPTATPVAAEKVKPRLVGGVEYEFPVGYEEARPDWQEGRMFAILVGIDKYPKIPGADLDFPVSDTNRFAEVLKTVFGVPAENITMLHNEAATREGIRAALNSFADSGKIGPYDQVFFMFSGHGKPEKMQGGEDVGFLVPYDAELALKTPNAERALATCLPMDEMRRLARFIPARHTFFLVDACFSGLATLKSEPKAAPTLAAALSLRSIQILTAGSRDQVVIEATNWGGSGTTKLLMQLFADHGHPDRRAEWRDGILTAGEIGAYLKTELPKALQALGVQHRQTPQFERMEGMGEFFLALPGTNLPVAPPMKAAYFSSNETTGPIGLYLAMASDVPAGSELSKTDVETIVAQALGSQEFTVYDEAALAKAMRDGDEAPTRFVIKGEVRYRLDPSDEDPFKTGKKASRARFHSALEAIDTYTGKRAFIPAEANLDQLFYLKDEIRDAIIKQATPQAASLAQGLRAYLTPPTLPNDPKTDPIVPVLFVETMAPDPDLHKVTEMSVAPGVIAAIQECYDARVPAAEEIGVAYTALGLTLNQVVSAASMEEFATRSKGRYAVSVAARKLGGKFNFALSLRDATRKGFVVAQTRVSVPADASLAAQAAVRNQVQEAVTKDLLPKLPRKKK